MMSRARTTFLAVVTSLVAHAAAAQAPPAPPPIPLWDVQLGASFVGTSGNSDTSSAGADFGLHRRWTVWQIESSAAAVRSSNQNVSTAERYLGAFRGQRKLTSIIGLSAGIKLERDQFSGIDFRSITDGGLTWALVRRPLWALDGITAIALNHEDPTLGPTLNHPVGLLQVLSRIPLGASGATTQRFTFYPDFKESDAYRSEFELAAQAAMTTHFALKLGYLVRRSNAPVEGFEKTDTMTTASVVMQWKAAAPAPGQ
jgi:putative salt-induced outer membrane protein YdiY